MKKIARCLLRAEDITMMMKNNALSMTLKADAAFYSKLFSFRKTRMIQIIF